MYSDRFAPVRELVSNSWDEDAKNVRILLEKDSIAFQDDGNGVEDPQQFVTKGDPSKRVLRFSKTLKRKLVGQKGLGNLSAFILGSRAEILTKNRRGRSYRIIFDEETILREMTVRCEPITDFKTIRKLPRGTMVKITGLRRMYSEQELQEYLSLAFRLLLDKSFRIFVNSKSVRAKPLPKGTVFSRKVKIRNGTMYFHLVDPDNPQDREAVAHYNPVLIKTVRLSERPHLTGHIYTDFLQVRTDRGDFIRDESYLRFEKELGRFLNSIPSSPESAGKRLLKSLRRIGKILLDVVKEMELSPQPGLNETRQAAGYLELSRSRRSGEFRLPVVKRTSKAIGRRIRVKFTDLQPSVKKKLPKRIAYGLNIECHQLSPKEPPVQRTAGNTIIINLSFPYIEQLVKLSDDARELALIPYVARGYSDFVARDTQELIIVTDKLTAELTNRYSHLRS